MEYLCVCVFVIKKVSKRNLFVGVSMKKSVTWQANASVVPSAYADWVDTTVLISISDAPNLLSSADHSTPNFTSNKSNTSHWITEIIR